MLWRFPLAVRIEQNVMVGRSDLFSLMRKILNLTKKERKVDILKSLLTRSCGIFRKVNFAKYWFEVLKIATPVTTKDHASSVFCRRENIFEIIVKLRFWWLISPRQFHEARKQFSALLKNAFTPVDFVMKCYFQISSYVDK